MKHCLILLVFIGFSNNLKSQHLIGSNLVPNPSFEQYTACPSSLSQICYAIPWFDASNCRGSSDFLHTCSADAFIQNVLLFNIPRTGNGCASLYLYVDTNEYSNYREYIEVKMSTKLVKNKKYCCNFYTLPSVIGGNIAIKNIDLLFSYNLIEAYDSLILGHMLIDSVPQIKNTNGIITDTVNWSKVTGIFTANGGEEYITLGNFYFDNQTNLYAFNNNYPFVSYYLIDDVSVCECSFDIDLGADAKLCEGDTKLLTANLPNATFIWQDGSTNATYEVKTPGTYWVKAYVAEYNITSSDTIIISAEDEKICNPQLIIPNFITPNGDAVNDNFQLGNADKFDISLQIYNRWGNLIYQNANYQNDYNCNGCADGVYYYLLTAKSKRNGKMKEYKGSVTVL